MGRPVSDDLITAPIAVTGFPELFAPSFQRLASPNAPPARQPNRILEATEPESAVRVAARHGRGRYPGPCLTFCRAAATTCGVDNGRQLFRKTLPNPAKRPEQVTPTKETVGTAPPVAQVPTSAVSLLPETGYSPPPPSQTRENETNPISPNRRGISHFGARHNRAPTAMEGPRTSYCRSCLSPRDTPHETRDTILPPDPPCRYSHRHRLPPTPPSQTRENETNPIPPNPSGIIGLATNEPSRDPEGAVHPFPLSPIPYTLAGPAQA